MKKLLFLLPLPLLLGAGKGAAPANPGTATAVPLSGLYLRAAFDDDPTESIGAFVLEAGGVPDDSRAAKLACSSYVSHKRVGGGGVMVTQAFSASQEAALKLGIPLVGGVGVGGDNAVSVLIQYQQTSKWQAVVADPTGFATCCATYADQCREHYVGDFLGGTGKIYYEVATKGGGKVGGSYQGVSGELMAYAGKQYQFANEFPNEVAFAFQLKSAPVASPPNQDVVCSTNWESAPPNDIRGHWETSVSDVFGDEAGARANAFDHAAVQFAKWCGVAVSSDSKGGRSDADGSSTIGSTSKWTADAKAVVTRMRLVCSRKEEAAAPRGTDYRFHGLYLLPDNQVEASCATLRTSLGTPL